LKFGFSAKSSFQNTFIVDGYPVGYAEIKKYSFRGATAGTTARWLSSFSFFFFLAEKKNTFKQKFI